ncbi:MAG: GDP-L-fucose synthase [Bacteroidetes bacterium]|nr:GDP-L-fucose synthase [Bacteroidota bacterium]
MNSSRSYTKKKIYLAGHRGMVGSAIHRKLEVNGYGKLLLKTFSELNLTRQDEVDKFFELEKPEVVIVAAAKVGGILANNTFRAEFIYDNLMIESNIIQAAHVNGVEKLIFLGSSCIYPKLAPQPLKEEYLLSDYLEFTNEPYAIAKIAGIKLCENYYRQYGDNFYSAMPTNLYGINDNFNLETSHVLPALMRKFHEAVKQKSEVRSQKSEEKKVTIWGSGKPKREFLYVDDLAEAILFLMENIEAKDLYEKGISQINIGTGEDLTIEELAKLISKITGFDGDIVYDSSKPDGTPRKLMDVSRIHSLGWHHKTSLEEGIRKTYEWFKTIKNSLIQ